MSVATLGLGLRMIAIIIYYIATSYVTVSNLQSYREAPPEVEFIT